MAVGSGLRDVVDANDRRSADLKPRRISAEPPSVSASIRDLLASRDLFVLLIAREFRVRFKQSALGIGWVVLQPLIPALIFAVVFGAFARLPSGGAPYLLFALSGMVIYVFFSTAASRAGTSFLRDSALLTKVHFPRALLPLASGASAVVDFGVGVLVLVVIGAVIGTVPGMSFIAVPLVALGALILGLGLGFAVAALSARFRDFALALPFLLQLLLYASPVVYSVELIPESVRGIYALNPLVALIEAFRWALLGTVPPSLWHVAEGLATGAVVTLIGTYVYRRQSIDLTDVI